MAFENISMVGELGIALNNLGRLFLTHTKVVNARVTELNKAVPNPDVRGP
jgi:hypothetical protein